MKKIDKSEGQISWDDEALKIINQNADTNFSFLCEVPEEILNNNKIQKIFHYARFDVAILRRTFEANIENIFCTKLASKLVRTYTDKHGLKELCRELLAIDLNKSQQSSDWSSEKLSENQIRYASHDVIHLFELKERLHEMLVREDRLKISEKI